MNEENKDLIAYCGLYCGDCIGYRQKAADLARDLRKELRKTKFEKTADIYPLCHSLQYIRTTNSVMRY